MEPGDVAQWVSLIHEVLNSHFSTGKKKKVPPNWWNWKA
jgi:hypothetical protein